ncbi:unnamed protein product [Caretta caretta]
MLLLLEETEPVRQPGRAGTKLWKITSKEAAQLVRETDPGLGSLRTDLTRPRGICFGTFKFCAGFELLFSNPLLPHFSTLSACIRSEMDISGLLHMPSMSLTQGVWN